ncbi:abortive infection family protein [Nocardia gipuzkoensis]|uniref:abortive infection family protein n=1 Tax=Nocardia TaxID=1817 RepID=UPI001E649FE4|nr:MULTISPECIES: abortive infection family protein [Nocardia]UGT70795.1 abortive infection family protein [Nocardia gipuzkoensis]
MTRSELVNKRTREAVRDQMSGTVLREVDEMWQDELFAPPEQDPEPVGGERVTRFQGYLDQVDWTDPGQVSRALRVFEVALRHLFHHPWAPDWDPSENIERLRRLFARDGYTFDNQGRITGGPPIVLRREDLGDLRDATVIFEHLDRIDHAVSRDDPALAIGSAKELVESTAKLVLRERGVPFDSGHDLPKLARMAEEALLVHPSQAKPGPDGSSTIRKVLGAALTITSGIAELRNDYGTGHGRDTAPSGLGPRHARLAVNGARLWCQFMLDTLADSKAPWRGTAPAGAGGALNDQRVEDQNASEPIL